MCCQMHQRYKERSGEQGSLSNGQGDAMRAPGEDDISAESGGLVSSTKRQPQVWYISELDPQEAPYLSYSP